jgi:hypothetical protein
MAYLQHIALSSNVDIFSALTITYSTGDVLGVYHVLKLKQCEK